MKPDLEIIYPELLTLGRQVIFKITYPKKTLYFKGTIRLKSNFFIFINFGFYSNNVIFKHLQINRKEFFKDISEILVERNDTLISNINTLKLMLKMLENYKEL